MNRITFDFETRSACDLKKAGAYKYSLDPTTQPTCMAFKVRNERGIHFLDFDEINASWGDQNLYVKSHWRDYIDEGYLFTAHNAFFERCIYENILVKRYGWPHIPFNQYRCTAAKAAAHALPRSLEGAGAALNLTIQKDKMGFLAMMATCKPTKYWNAWKKANEELKAGKPRSVKRLKAAKTQPKKFLDYKDDPTTWDALYHYCKIDVVTEELLDKTLPDLSPTEQEVWQLNQEINWRGIRIDIPTVQKIVDISAREKEEKLEELDTLTMGLVTKAGARQAILDFLAVEGVELPNIQAKTVDDALKSGKLSPDMQRLLEIRKALSKTSTKKYQAMLDRAGEDHRVRDILLYHGASTGRDSGTGVQFQNLPKRLISQKAVDMAIDLLEKEEDVTEWLHLFHGESLAMVFSSLMRGMLIPSKGHELFVSDLAKIEVAVLWWLADNWPGLEILNAGKDPYKYQAAANTGKRYEDISDDGDERQLGKAQVLGCGFRMSWKRFQSTAFDMYRLKLTKRQSVDAVKSYREANKAVCELWDKYENAAIQAVENPEFSYIVGKCTFYSDHDFLRVTLPSGRRLSYPHPCIAWRSIKYVTLEVDEKTGKEYEVERTSSPKKTLQFSGLDLSKKNLQVEFSHGGILTENIVQATARDLMKNGELGAEKAGYKVLVTVHDEVVAEKEKGKGSVEEFKRIMCTKPSWADEHLPLDAKASSPQRYCK